MFETASVSNADLYWVNIMWPLQVTVGILYSIFNEWQTALVKDPVRTAL